MQLQLVTAAVKLFLKSPQPRAQQMIQLVLTYATQVREALPPPVPSSCTAHCRACHDAGAVDIAVREPHGMPVKCSAPPA